MSTSVPQPTSLLLQAFTVLDNLGRRLAELEAEVAFLGISLRKRYVDPNLFKHLSSSRFPWSAKKKIIKAYRQGATKRSDELRRACERIWTILRGQQYKHDQDFQRWNAGKKVLFDSLWSVKRRTVLRSIQRNNQTTACGRPPDINNQSNLTIPHVVNPCEVSISRKTEQTLGNGPKFCMNVKPSRVDVFSAIQTISKVTGHDERATFVDCAVDRMDKLMNDSFRTEKRDFRVISAAVKELERGSLRLLQTDKSGMFGVLPETVFRRKADEALGAVFIEWKGNIKKIKKNIVEIFKEDEMDNLAKQVVNQTRSSLSLKFFLKDHKPDMPFRTVINELGTWQCSVSKFLQRGLNVIQLEGSLSLRNSEALIDVLEGFHGRQCTVMSMDIKDLYYSLEKVRLMQRVRQVLELNLVNFQSRTGIAVDSFLSLLDLYLQATVVEYNGQKYVQKDGVCIGSSVAPMLAEIYLNTLDSSVSETLKENNLNGCIVKRYVDD
ncbi:uncharacterized protein LOC121838139, partial [Ixodes scapularis]|uniref:uncharacterized protein LOC121838139 n=1 Tax=Ixodes scapularis TaxID=6945 RepID=UPI001A9E9189